MRIAIEARVTPGLSGGVAPALRSLLAALGALADGSEQYTIVVDAEQQIDWLPPLGQNQNLVMREAAGRAGLLRKSLSPFGRRLRRWVGHARAWPEVPISDGFYEGLGCDVVHFPTQGFTVCAVPSVYNPHDLLHLHYPQFFIPAELAWRDTVYRAGCHFARTVVVNSQWVKDDIVEKYGISSGKVQVVPEAPPTQFLSDPPVDEPEQIKARYGLPDAYVLFPSVTWPHKNHLRLLEALAYLRDTRSLIVPLVCTGSRLESFWPRIEQRIDQLGLSDQLHFLGFVPEKDLRSLYRLARCLVLPTLFEANSLPIFEAWLEGTPVACSSVTALPEQVMDAGLLFDPLDCQSIGTALASLFTDERLRGDLRAKGLRRLADFDWARTAKAYRAIYRRAGGQRLNEEDRALLEWDWMRSPRRPAHCAS